MADERHTHLTDREDRSSGLDVWLPAAAAIIAAFVLIATAHAETAPPRVIYDAARFDEAAIAREAADVAIARAEAEAGATVTRRHQMAVTVVALTALEAPAARPAPAAVPVAASPALTAARMAPVAPGWLRTLLPLGIAALLALALIGIARVWTRTEPSLA
jgi:hypothetical protein